MLEGDTPKKQDMAPSIKHKPSRLHYSFMSDLTAPVQLQIGQLCTFNSIK
jgi:hypothetical protein